MGAAYRWDGQRLRLDTEHSETVRQARDWSDLEGEEWQEVYGYPPQWGLPFVKVLQHTQGVVWRILVFWANNFEIDPLTAMARPRTVTALDLITCDHMGEMLPCLDYLLTILERMHRVEDVVGTKDRLWWLRMPPAHMEARARLTTAGFDPVKVEKEAYEQAKKDQRDAGEALWRAQHPTDQGRADHD